MSIFKDWKQVVSGGKPISGPLGKTLANFPGCVPLHILTSLSNVELTRPVYQRVELISIVVAGNRRHKEIIQKATRKQILRAAKLVGKHTRTRYNMRKTKDIDNVISFIIDYPLTHNGNIVGLTEKSIRWHREEAYTNARQSYNYGQYSEDATTKLPPIDLPKIKGVTFLDTVGKIFEEGAVMRHCVSGYSGNAVKGTSYLFHVEHNNETATVEVSPQGYVVQSRGPRNSENKATKWAASKLGKWAEGLRLHKTNDNFEATEDDNVPF